MTQITFILPELLIHGALLNLGARDMAATFEQRLQKFHRDTIEQMRSAGLSAYVLNEDGSVLRFRPDGTREYIVSGSAIAASHKPDISALVRS